MRKIRLSSSITFIHKFISPFVSLLAIVIMIRFVHGATLRQFPPFYMLILFVAFAGGMAMTAWLSYKIKKVFVEGDYLIVSDYKKEIAVPLSDIYDVTEMRWMQPYWITISFRKTTEFGDSILFVPPFRLLSFWVANPLVEEIRSMAHSRPRHSW
ncbi:MAG: hypothetical protein KF855_15740 [Acidobacteria bacterium]|nr:hypothetical protein [Acidobacteriota bacterium]